VSVYKKIVGTIHTSQFDQNLPTYDLRKGSGLQD